MTLRAHAAAAAGAEEQEKALLVFTDLWKSMRRLVRFGDGRIWSRALLQVRTSLTVYIVCVVSQKGGSPTRLISALILVQLANLPSR